MMSMLSGIQDLVTPGLLSRVSAQTGESESAISKGFAAVLPAILGTLVRRSDDTGFTSHLGNMISAAPAGTDAITQAAFAAADTPTPTAGLPPLMTALFGKTLSGIIENVSKFAGIRTTSASSLFSVATPLVLGYLGTMMRTQNLDIGAVVGQLKNQQQTLASALPAGFTTPETLAPVAAAAGHRVTHGWLWMGAALALILGGLVYWGVRGPAARQVAPRETIGTTGVAAGLRTHVLPGNVSVQVAPGGMEDRLIAYLGSPGGAITTPSFAFDRIRFDTGSAVLTGESRDQIATVANVLMAYPKAMVGVSGHTDNVGSESGNRTLSRARAQAVADALVASGVPSGRIYAQGYGSSRPVADNSTDEGRALNRRVVLEIER